MSTAYGASYQHQSALITIRIVAFRRLSVDPDASHNVEDDAGRPKMALDELAKNGE